MDSLLHFIALLLVRGIQMLPLETVARLGRTLGGLAWQLDGRHRKVALNNLEQSFGKEMDSFQIRAIAKENFRRLGESYACGIKTAAMTWEELKPYCEFIGGEKLLRQREDGSHASVVVAIGHFGNFELYARFGAVAPGYQCATTYRGLRQPGLNQLMQAMREKSGCLFFERRADGQALKTAMSEQRLILGLLADQHAGDRGLRLPFFGRDCSTSAAPAVFALRYHAPLFSAICYRTGLARWRIEVGDEIPTSQDGVARPVEDVTRDINSALEVAIRRDPANWFWVHKRWKANKYRGGEETKTGASTTEPEVHS